MHKGGGLRDPNHYDVGSLITVDVMLEEAEAGGRFQTLEPSGRLLTHRFKAGDALVFQGHKRWSGEEGSPQSGATKMNGSRCSMLSWWWSSGMAGNAAAATDVTGAGNTALLDPARRERSAEKKWSKGGARGTPLTGLVPSGAASIVDLAAN
ncbi:unnamed protein product [Cladocopium goreaui]|uniref:Fe2OG dioxygenase domain-containing protein n=1 Tax=Cladocopium goreaui TaxID=2562237 RepID=A0A9P1G8W6_9DINO|nr:unnamed protein product [Cladocopium goreaui]